MWPGVWMSGGLVVQRKQALEVIWPYRKYARSDGYTGTSQHLEFDNEETDRRWKQAVLDRFKGWQTVRNKSLAEAVKLGRMLEESSGEDF